ncbi:MAG TPA: HNH endonuclease signature motif containing protein [Terriglobales bacterium]|nr:HNH endonuclease signature motif containing protein [Terriglobales bacterium]
MPRTTKPGAIHLKIIEVMKRFPEGITGGQIRSELAKEGLGPDEQTHLDRRKRDLSKWFVIEKRSTTTVVNGKNRRHTLYKFLGERVNVADEGQISLKLRAEVIHAAHGRCQMCGRTVTAHRITLVVDHKKPRDWGGTNDRDNLWAICEDCNAGKKAYFSSVHADPEFMKKILLEKSVHVRIGETLKAFGVGRPVPASLIEILADQDDWHKRLRELRYPVVGWKIIVKKHRAEDGRVTTDYILERYKEWSPDPTGDIRRFELERKRRNRQEL